jgi:hypothetical protein
MVRIPARVRLLDVAVALVCCAIAAAGVLPIAGAANGSKPLIEDGATVDSRVAQAGMISNPLNGSFERTTSGRADGSVQWDMYTTSPQGLKLVVSTTRSPAMRDEASGIDVPDLTGGIDEWRVPAGGRTFGISASGKVTMSPFADGTRWRGLNGRDPVEVARRAAAMPMTRTTVRLRAQYDRALPSSGTPSANIVATAVPNL